MKFIGGFSFITLHTCIAVLSSARYLITLQEIQFNILYKFVSSLSFLCLTFIFGHIYYMPDFRYQRHTYSIYKVLISLYT